MTSSLRGPLAGPRVLDLADEKGHYATKLLADLGADVIKVEPPGGAPARRTPPFVADQLHPDRSLYFWHYNTSKRGLVLDLERETDRRRLRDLVAGADVLVETFPPGYLDTLGLGYAHLAAINPRLIVTSITGFGQTGPWRAYRTSDLIAQALAGVMYVTGAPDTPPLRLAASQAFHTAGLYGAIATLTALAARGTTGRGQHVDLSVHEAQASAIEYVTLFWIYSRKVPRRMGAVSWSRNFRVVQCRDGAMVLSTHDPWSAVVDWAAADGLAGELTDPKWQKLINRRTEWEAIFRAFEPWAKLHTRDELFHGGQARRMPWGPVNTPADLLSSPQLQARRWFVEVEHPELGRTVTYPGAPYQFSRTPWQIQRRPPLLDEHAGATWSTSRESRVPSPELDSPTRDSRPATRDFGAGALAGVRVADFTWVMAGPYATRILADQGAEVIKIESSARLDRVRAAYPDVSKDGQMGRERSGYFNNLNRNKLGISLNLTHPRAVDLAKEIIRVSDFVIDNYSANVMAKFGLDYEALRRINPSLIQISMAGLGQTGPWRDYRTFGPTLQAMAGLTYLTAFPESGPLGSSFALADHVGGMTAALAALAALEHRRRTGEGQFVDLAQYEATCALLETAVLDYTVNGRDAKPLGNRSPAVAPHNAYPCLGDDRWIALAIFSDADWQRLGDLAGQAWARDPRFATNEGRLAHQADLDRAIGDWTATQPAEALMDRLQRAGLCAGVVQTAEDLVEHDPQLRARGFFVEVDHPVIGRVPVDGPAFRLSETPPSVRTAAPLLGQHTAEVLTGLLGLSQAEVDQLAADGVI